VVGFRIPARQLLPTSPFLAETARRFAIPEHWICAVIEIESAGNVNSCIASRSDLMQIMPGTWGEFSVRDDLGVNSFDPRDNIFAGTAYSAKCSIASDRKVFLVPSKRVRSGMRVCLDRWRDDKAIFWQRRACFGTRRRLWPGRINK
jgi:transglycosylase-like protein with SLT domain